MARPTPVTLLGRIRAASIGPAGNQTLSHPELGPQTGVQHPPALSTSVKPLVATDPAFCKKPSDSLFSSTRCHVPAKGTLACENAASQTQFRSWPAPASWNGATSTVTSGSLAAAAVSHVSPYFMSGGAGLDQPVGTVVGGLLRSYAAAASSAARSTNDEFSLSPGSLVAGPVGSPAERRRSYSTARNGADAGGGSGAGDGRGAGRRGGGTDRDQGGAGTWTGRGPSSEGKWLPNLAGNHYEVLGISRDAPLAVIKAAFRQRAKELHPDVLAARSRRGWLGQLSHRHHPVTGTGDDPHQQANPQPHATTASPSGQDHQDHRQRRRHDQQQHQHHQRRQSSLPQQQHSYPHQAAAAAAEPYDSEVVEASASAFLRIAAAYEVLSSPSRRREYDMQLAAKEARRSSSSTSRSTSSAAQRQQPTAAAGGSAGGFSATAAGGVAGDALRQVDFRSWRYGVGEWMMRPRREPVAGRSAALEYYLRKYSHEFESQLHAALVHAYLGPKLDLQPGELPRCFEADLRRQPGLSDQLMHLVSGRTLLGVVRVKEPLRLAAGTEAVQAAAAAAIPAAEEPPSTAPGPASGSARAAAVPSRTPSPEQDEGQHQQHSDAEERAAAAASLQAQAAAELAAGPAAPSDARVKVEGAIKNRNSVVPHSLPLEQAAWESLGGQGADHGKAGTRLDRPGHSAAGRYNQGADGLDLGRNRVDAAAVMAVAPVVAEREAVTATGGPSDNDAPGQPDWAAADAAVAEMAAAVVAGGGGAPGGNRGVDPLDVLDRAEIQGLSDEAVVQLAAVSLVRSDVGAAGYSRVVPGYSRLRGLLELQGFYPDPAVLQRRSTQISLVTAAEAAQAREAAAAGLGGRRLQGRWKQQQQQQRESSVATAAGQAPAEAHAPGDGDGLLGKPAVEGQGTPALKAATFEAAARASEAAGAGRGAERSGERVPADVMPPAQLQGLVEATRVAEAELAEAAAADHASRAARPPPPPPPRNDPRDWPFGPDAAFTSGYGSSADQTVNLTVLEMRLGQDLSAIAVHQPPLTHGAPPSPSSSSPAAAVDAAKAAAEDVIGAVRQAAAGIPWAPKPEPAQGLGDARPPAQDGAVAAWLAAGGGGTSSHSGGGSVPPEPPLEGTMVPLFGPVVEGRVKIYVGGRLEAGVEGRHVYDATGRRVALVVRGSFPGLRTIHFFDATTRRLRLTCRCVRARLLPSPTWLFPPREDTHDIGGWYFEWGGYGRRGQFGWLDPSVYVFVAALVTAEQERIAVARRRAIAELADDWRQGAWRVVKKWMAWPQAGSS